MTYVQIRISINNAVAVFDEGEECVEGFGGNLNNCSATQQQSLDNV